MEQAVLLEDLMGETQERLLRKRMIGKVAPSYTENIKEGIRLFKEQGWPMVNVNL